MAGRIPQQFIDDLLERVDITEVIDRRVPLKKTGKNFSACCPFHEEKTPSFSVNQDKQFFYCFGCGAGGNAIGFLMDYERIDFPQAVEKLADMAGLEVPREASAFQEEPQQKTSIYNLLEKAADYYAQQLRKHPSKQRAVDYLKGRGLTGEIAASFTIGYAPPGWDNLINAIGASDEDKQLLIDGGMLIDKPEEDKCYDRFRDRIMFPIRDNRGRVIAFGGRVLGDDKPKYLNSPETIVFHKSKELYGLYQAKKSKHSLSKLLIVEGYMDVVALAQHGIHWAAATLGTATSTEHLKRVFRLVPEVVFCFDGDAAGRKAALRAMESVLPVMGDGKQAKFLFLPDGEDPDSLVRSIGANEFERLVNQATPLENFIIESQSQELDLNTLEGKARLSTLASPLIAQLPSGVFKELMWQSLASHTGLEKSQLLEIVNQAPPKPAPGPVELDEPHYPYSSGDYSDGDYSNSFEPMGMADNVEPVQRSLKSHKTQTARDPARYALMLLLSKPSAASGIEIGPALKQQETAYGKLLVEMIELLHKRPDSTTAMLVGHWMTEPEGELINELLQIDSVVPEQNIEQELRETLGNMDWQYHQEQIDSRVDKLSAKGYANLSDEEKAELSELLIQRRSK